MNRTTIDFGIDLGTTNSAIAVLKGIKPEVVKSNLDTDIIPSAVFIARQGNVIVGSKAKMKLEDSRSAEDAYIEFKRRMGGDSAYTFRSSGLRKSPEELSAEVLKSLKGNVQQRMGEDIRAAVITIPAAFAQRQCVATKRAAEMAGFMQCPLLQEPVAASLAYGFQNDSGKRSFWLVFDFGGGTFDAAVMKAQDGDIQVVNHGGDNFLGGADIDWGVIEKIIIPEITASYNLPDFKRGNDHWRSAFAKIKRAVEFAKIDLSRSSEAYLDACVFEDDDGREVELDGFKLTQRQLVNIAEPLIARAADKCKAVLAEKNLEPSAIEKTILVGGPTLAPYFRDILADKLGIPLDHSVDPLTVVAQGAAVFAGTQRIDRTIRTVGAAPAAAGTYKLTINYKPIGPDDDPMITGEVEPPPGGDIAGCTIEFTNRRTKWSSGVVPVNAEGKFILRLRAERGDQNIFDIALVDARGSKLPCDTTEIAYTIGVSIKAQITCNDISIELKENQILVMVPKGTEYPFKKTTRKTTTDRRLAKGEPGRIIIPVLEAKGGDAGRLADHNMMLGKLVLTADKLHRDLPLGSEIEVTLSAKEPGALIAEAYVPLLDETFTAKIDYDGTPAMSESDLRGKFRNIENDASSAKGKSDAQDRQTIDEIIGDINSLWDGAGSIEGANQIQERLIELRMKLDDIEARAKIPEIIEEIEYFTACVEKCETSITSAQRTELAFAKKELERLRSKNDIGELERLLERVLELWRDVMHNRPEHWRGLLQYLFQRRAEMLDQVEAARLLAQGAKAIEMNDIDMMRRCGIMLLNLLPEDAKADAQRGHIASGDGGLVIGD
ncbi:MAG: Hsp70 family protein [Kiritimatiellae bacterium]|nr:Hsp70 family protein [Kiritimatiellia bacterium]